MNYLKISPKKRKVIASHLLKVSDRVILLTRSLSKYMLLH